MSVNKITEYTHNAKSANGTLSHQEWNTASQAVEDSTKAINNIIDVVNAGGSGSGGGGSIDSYVYKNSKGNLNIVTTEADVDAVSGKGAKINIEPYSDLQIKPGDDISFYAHHRSGKEDELSIKILSEAKAIDNTKAAVDCPVKLQLNASEILLTTKDKNLNPKYKADETYVMDVTVNSEQNTRGYLKVRASAIDLRCEKHGGIALQPKGFDSGGNMNKIKFEHGGGDGLEFGTFNAEKTSIFTDEYRFNKDGVWKMATREKAASGKKIANETESGELPTGKEATGAYKYVKQNDDFYDIIDGSDETATTNDIIKTAHSFNAGKNRHTNYKEKTKNGVTTKTLEVETVTTVGYVAYEGDVAGVNEGSTTEATTTLIDDGEEHSFEIQYWRVIPISRIVNEGGFRGSATYKISFSDTTSFSGTFIVKTGDNIQSGTQLGTFTFENDWIYILSEENITYLTNNNITSISVGSQSPNITVGEATLKEYVSATWTVPSAILSTNSIYTESDFSDAIATVEINDTALKYGTDVKAGDVLLIGGNKYTITEYTAPNISIKSDQGISINAKGLPLELKGEGIEFGSDTINLGEMEEGLITQIKYTKAQNKKYCDILKVVAVNNYTSSVYFNPVTGEIDLESGTGKTEVASKSTVEIASCSLYDIIKLVNYMKTEQQGPWANS